MTINEIGCCGAYCKTCMKHQKEKYPQERTCRGCKLGYESGQRDLSKAKCKIKVCCFIERKLQTCADCMNDPCEILTKFWSKNGRKYQQYKNQIQFIRRSGYDDFLKCANEWNGPFGKLGTAQK